MEENEDEKEDFILEKNGDILEKEIWESAFCQDAG